MFKNESKALTDCDVYVVLDWFYDHREVWLTEAATMFSKQDLIQDDLDWMTEHGLLLSKTFEENGAPVKRYRISPGGVLERARHKQDFWMRLIPISVSILALLLTVFQAHSFCS